MADLYPSWMVWDGKILGNALCKLLGMTTPTPWKAVKRRGKWHTLDLHGVMVDIDEHPPRKVREWMDEHVGKDQWRFKVVWLFNPVDGDIPMFRLYFPNLELLTQFRLVWHGSFT